MTAPPSTETPRHTATLKLVMGEIVCIGPNDEEAIPYDEAVIHLEGDEDSEIRVNCPGALRLAPLIVTAVNSHASLTAKVAELEAAILFWRMARYPENRPDPHDIEGRCLVQASLDLAESTLYQMSLKVAALDNADGGRE